MLFILQPAFAADNIKHYYIDCSAEELKHIMENYSEDIYINASLTVDNQRWDNLRMRIRGSGTRVFPKKSFKLQFDNAPFLNGKSTLNLNAEYEDPTYIRSTLSARIFRDLGVPCFNTEHVILHINGELEGLFVQIENMDDEFFIDRKIAPIGNLYKATNDGSCLSLADVFKDVWEKKTNENSDSSDFENFRYAINTIPDSEYETFCKSVLDYDNMLKMIAINWLILNGSTYYHNYYMYHYANNDGKWAMFPWDLDKTFSKNSLFRPIDQSTENWTADNPFLERALFIPSIYKDLRNTVDSLRDKIINKEYLYPIIDSLISSIRSSVLADTNDNITTEKQWLDAIDYDKYMIDKRHAEVCKQLDSCPTPFRLINTPSEVIESPILRWNRSISRNNQTITYKLYYSTSRYYAESKTTVIDNLTDTLYQLPDTIEKNKVTYWRVEAISGKYLTEGYDNFNYFTIKQPTEVPCEISSEYRLLKSKSPYVINCYVKIRNSGRLLAEPGVKVYFQSEGNIYCTGGMDLNGTDKEPIELISTSNSDVWNFIKLENTLSNCKYSYCNLTNIQTIAINSDIQYLNNRIIATKPLSGILVRMDNSIVNFRQNHISGIKSGEGVISAYSTGQISNNKLELLRDAIQIIDCNPFNIENNVVINCGDDGIDLNKCKNVIIKNNILNNIEDKGITVGDLSGIGSENIIIERNQIANCKGAGINVKNGSSARVLNNTLYDNENNISLNQILESPVNTNVEIINTIFLKAKSKDIISDEKSSYSIRYSISDKFVHNGIGNLLSNPQVKDPDKFNFDLLETSPCIDAGDPNTPKDKDGTISDIGALSFEQANNSVVINEINYKSGLSVASDDWIELYNNSSINVDLSNWILKDDDDSHQFIIPDNTIIKANEFVILAQNANKFKLQYPNVQNVVGDFVFGLGSSSDQVRIYNGSGLLVDSVAYTSQSPWSEAANGTGGTLQLINPNYDNSQPESWIAINGVATPGNQNNTSSVNIENNILSYYPNPAREYIEINFPFEQNQNTIDYSISDISQREIINSKTQISDSSLRIKVSNLVPGKYFLCLILNDKQYNISFVKE